MRHLAKPAPGGKPLAGWYQRLASSDDWTCEAKMDGVRALWTGFRLLTRTGNHIPHSEGASAALEGRPCMDGEFSDGVFWAFDLPDHGGDYDGRRRDLDVLLGSAGGDYLEAMPAFTDWRGVKMFGWEGVVFKRRSSLYPRAFRQGVTTPDWIKFRAAWL